MICKNKEVHSCTELFENKYVKKSLEQRGSWEKDVQEDKDVHHKYFLILIISSYAFFQAFIIRYTKFKNVHKNKDIHKNKDVHKYKDVHKNKDDTLI